MRFQAPVAFAALLCGAGAFSPPAEAQETLTLQTISSSGANTSPGAAQTIDNSDGTNLPLFNAALAAFNAKNADTVQQNASSFSSGGQFVSPQFFPFGSPAVSVNSNLDVTGHLTAPGMAGAVNYFAFAETAGAQIGLYGAATAPANQGTELLLFDPNGNLVALAAGNAFDGRSSIIAYTVPGGDGGAWQAAITQGFAYALPIDSMLQLQMPYTAVSQFTTNVVGSGQEKNGSLGAYDVNANAGDNLMFDVHATTPATATELLLFDPIGNLVALAAGNGFDGLSSIIDFQVPNGDAGQWKILVAPNQNLSLPQPYAYDLVIQGFSGLGSVNPSAVPEPGVWALLLLGFGGLGAVGRRKTNAAKAALASRR